MRCVFAALVVPPAFHGLMRIDDVKLVGSDIVKADDFKEGPASENGTEIWARFRASAKQSLQRTEAALSPTFPERIESAKKAMAEMRDRATDEIDAAKDRIFGGTGNKAARTVTPDLCTPGRDIGFSRATTIYSNLGGLGPDFSSPQSLRFANVFPESGLHVDMLVTATTKYVGTPAGKNALTDDFLVINVNSGSSVRVRFSFVDRLSGAPVDVPAFLFTIAGLAHQEGGGSKQSVTMGGHTDVYESNESQVLVSTSGVHSTMFSSTIPETTEESKPKQALKKSRNMSPKHLQKAITLRMPHLSHFEMSLEVKPGIGSRDFYFSGASNMVCGQKVACDTFTCPRFFHLKPEAEGILCQGKECTEEDVTTCCAPTTPEDCHPRHTLVLNHQALHHSNLGGYGPDAQEMPSILFENVFPNSAKVLDLEITAQNAYTPANVSLNRVYNKRFGSVNVAPGTELDLLFSFYEHGTRTLLVPGHRFFLTFQAFDKKNGMGIDQVRIDESAILASKMLNADTVQTDTDNLNRTVFSSQAPPVDDTPEVSLLLANRAQFSFTVSAPAGRASQTFRFAGYSTAGCPPLQSLCERATCPGGHRKRVDAFERRCARDRCALEDVGTCCETIEEEFCDSKNYVKFAPDSLLESNLGGYGPNENVPEHMFLSDILPLSGQLVNMRISAVGKYAMSSVPQNGMSGEFIKIDVEAGEMVHLKFEFLDEEEGDPLEIPMFYLTVADIDRGYAEYSIESVGLIGNKWVNITDGSTLVRTNEPHGGRTWSFFSGSVFGDERFSPFEKISNKFDTKKSLGALFKRVSELELILKVSDANPDQGTAHPRSFYLGGQTSLACPVERASCVEYVCPQKKMLRPNAASLNCAGPQCSHSDASTCCHPSNDDECSSTRAMVISPHSLVHSNLCGLGPDEGQAALIYSDVFPGSGRALDLEVTGVTGCSIFDPSRTGLAGTMASVSLQAGAAMGLTFRIVNAKTREEASSLWPYIVTFLNMDAPFQDATTFVEIAVSNLMSYQVTDSTTVRVENNTFRSGSHSHRIDQPRHAHALMPRHLARSVALKFNTPVFDVRAWVSKGFMGGHDLMFAGSSNLACPALAFCSTAQCPEGHQLRSDANSTTCLGAMCTELDHTTCCMRTECADERMLVFQPHRVRYSNLGGQGPDTAHEEAIVYADVFPNSGQEVDLEVIAQDRYFKPTEPRNGVDGPFGCVSMAPGTDLTLTFRFVEPGTHALASVSPFLFSIFNLTLPDEDTQKMVNVSDARRYYVSRSTKLRQEHHLGKLYFTSDADENEWRLHGSPTHPLALGLTQQNHSISFVMPAVSEFTVSGFVSAGWSGHNILFAGASSIACAPRALCNTHQCPAKMVLKRTAAHTTCKERRCNHMDTDNCCEARSTEEAFPATMPTPYLIPRKSEWALDEDVMSE